MKSTGTCPKCSAGDVHVVAMDWRRIGAEIPTGLFTRAKIDHYVCGHCGYVETYISDPEDVAKIAEKWPRVQ